MQQGQLFDLCTATMCMAKNRKVLEVKKKKGHKVKWKTLRANYK